MGDDTPSGYREKGRVFLFLLIRENPPRPVGFMGAAHWKYPNLIIYRMEEINRRHANVNRRGKPTANVGISPEHFGNPPV